jgi:hypothetical protein
MIIMLGTSLTEKIAKCGFFFSFRVHPHLIGKICKQNEIW